MSSIHTFFFQDLLLDQMMIDQLPFYPIRSYQGSDLAGVNDSIRQVSDSILVTGAEAVLPMPQLFGYVIQGERIDTGFLGAAQIDRRGSLNSTLIGGSYARPVACPAPGGGRQATGRGVTRLITRSGC